MGTTLNKGETRNEERETRGTLEQARNKEHQERKDKGNFGTGGGWRRVGDGGKFGTRAGKLDNGVAGDKLLLRYGMDF